MPIKASKELAGRFGSQPNSLEAQQSGVLPEGLQRLLGIQVARQKDLKAGKRVCKTNQRVSQSVGGQEVRNIETSCQEAYNQQYHCPALPYISVIVGLQRSSPTIGFSRMRIFLICPSIWASNHPDRSQAWLAHSEARLLALQPTSLSSLLPGLPQDPICKG